MTLFLLAIKFRGALTMSPQSMTKKVAPSFEQATHSVLFVSTINELRAHWSALLQKAQHCAEADLLVVLSRLVRSLSERKLMPPLALTQEALPLLQGFAPQYPCSNSLRLGFLDHNAQQETRCNNDFTTLCSKSR